MEKTTPIDFITDAYLIWVGSEHYGLIDDYTSEAAIMGISKRIPSIGIGRQMMEPGAVVFVAHDEGKKKDCKKCAGKFECPDCRKRTEEIGALRIDCDKMIERYADVAKAEKQDFRDCSKIPTAARVFVERRERKIGELKIQLTTCTECDGAGMIHGGTGGAVTLTDGVAWDYRKYNYYLHQPKKFDPSLNVAKKDMCKTCGGTGELPIAQIFGVFIPEKLEYILTGEETPEELAALPDAEKISADRLKVESKRRCGKRKPGGVYVTTTVGETTVEAKKTLKELEKRGLVSKGAADVSGSFIRFRSPLKVNEKRFRGVKRIDMSKVSRAAKMEAAGILEAMA
jgi:hypothetical protein